MKGKQLVLKNPANTARIKFLLELYPDAKFIHIYRNPYIVYPSTQNLFQKAIRPFMLQKVSDDEINDYIINIYKDIMKSYFNERNLIPKHNLTEIRYEEVEKNPILQLNQIYSELSLDGFDKVKPKFARYLKSVNGYKKNAYKLDENMVNIIDKNWGFAINKWKYDVPEIN